MKTWKSTQCAEGPEHQPHRSGRVPSRRATAGVGLSRDALQAGVLVGKCRDHQRDDPGLVAQVIGGGRAPGGDRHGHHEFAGLFTAPPQHLSHGPGDGREDKVVEPAATSMRVIE